MTQKLPTTKSAPASSPLTPGLILGVVALATALFVLVIIGVTQQTQQATSAPKTSLYAGIPQTTTADGSPVIGSPNAQLVFEEYSDFSCPHCATYNETTMTRLIEEYVKPGKARIIYRPEVFVGQQYSVNAAKAALCAGKQGQFWEMHDEVFVIHRSQGPRSFVPEVLSASATKLKLDLNKFTQCFNSNDTVPVLESAYKAGEAAGVDGTPSLRYSTDGGVTFQWFKDSSGRPLVGAPTFEAIVQELGQR
jgi:protein-disulfide isomerase